MTDTQQMEIKIKYAQLVMFHVKLVMILDHLETFLDALNAILVMIIDTWTHANHLVDQAIMNKVVRFAMCVNHLA